MKINLRKKVLLISDQREKKFQNYIPKSSSNEAATLRWTIKNIIFYFVF